MMMLLGTCDDTLAVTSVYISKLTLIMLSITVFYVCFFVLSAHLSVAIARAQCACCAHSFYSIFLVIINIIWVFFSSQALRSRHEAQRSIYSKYSRFRRSSCAHFRDVAHSQSSETAIDRNRAENVYEA